VLSSHPPDRLRIEIESLIGPSLADRGYYLVSSGPSRLTWRRERPVWVWVLLAIILLWAVTSLIRGFLWAVASLVSGSPDGGALFIAVGLSLGGGGYLLFKWRQPAVVVFHIYPGKTVGTEVVIEGRDGLELASVLRSAIGVETEA